MKLIDIKDKVYKNKIIKFLYNIAFYFDLGKGQVARLYQFIPDLIIILGGIKYLLGIELNKIQMGAFFIIIVLLFITVGYVMKHSGLWETDVYIQYEKNPASKELLEAARKINKGSI